MISPIRDSASRDGRVAFASRKICHQRRDDIFRENAVGRGCYEGLHQHPTWLTGCAVHQIDRLLTVFDASILVTSRKFKSETRYWLISGLQFRSPHGGVEVQIDRRAINDLRNLVAFVVIEKDVAVKSQCSIEQRVLRSKLIGIYVFGIECQWMNGNAMQRQSRIVSEHRARRIGPSRLIAVRK